MTMFNLKDYRISTKLLIAFGLSIIFISGMIAVAIVEMASVNRLSRQAHDEVFTEAVALLELKADLEDARRGLLTILSEANPEKLSSHTKRLEAATSAIDSRLDGLLEDTQHLDARSINTLGEIRTLWNAFRETRDTELLPAFYAGDRERALAIATGVQEERYSKFMDLVSGLVAYEKSSSMAALSAAEGRFRESIWLFVIISLAGLVVAASTLAFLIRNLTTRLRKIESGVKTIEAGSLDHEIEVTGSDEIGALALSFNKMRRSLHEANVSREQYLKVLEWNNKEAERKAREVLEANRLLKETQEKLESRKAELEDANKVLAKARSEVLHKNRQLKVERKALKASEDRFRSLVETSSDWVWEVDRSGAYTYSSPKVKDILGYEPEEMLGKSPFDFMDVEEAGRVRSIFRDLAARAAPITMLENTNIHKDGRLVVLETSGTPIFDDSGAFAGYRGMDRDITRRIRSEEDRVVMERQLIQADKMASLGQLAAGVAHEMNNPASYVKSNLNALREYLGAMAEEDRLRRRLSAVADGLAGEAGADDPSGTSTNHEEARRIFAEAEAIIDETHDGVEKILSIVRSLRDFSHPSDQTLSAYDIHICIESAIRIAQSEFKDRVVVATEYGEVPEVMCRSQQVSQVLLNIIVNASQAMDRGTISIKTGREGEFAVITITDDGAGMTEEARKRAFDPFFTTKPVGEGTGLGLAVSYGIVRDHGGTIDLESVPGKGTTFIIKLPIDGPGERVAAIAPFTASNY